MTIRISTNGYHRSEVDDNDIERARAAAKAVLSEAGVTAEAAAAAYRAQWSEFDDEAPMTGLALTWIAARQAADVAITAGWLNPGAEVFCEIDA